MDKERFIRAIAFCLSCDEHGTVGTGDSAKYLEIARWTMLCTDALPEPQDADFKIALVWGGATKIKGYVFESARLPEIRGASGLLDRINTVDVPRLWEEMGSEDCIIYANGGEILGFAPCSRAAQVSHAIETIYARETLVAQGVAMWEEFTLRQLREGLLAGENVDDATVKAILGHNPARNKTFGSLVTSLATARFRRREANPDTSGHVLRISHLETVPLSRRCSSCDRRGAVLVLRLTGDERPLCEPCTRKRVYGQMAKDDDPADTAWYEASGLVWDARPRPSWVRQFEEWLRRQPLDVRKKYPRGARAADDLGEIAQASKPEGFVGVVYADGNNLGAELEKLRTPSDYRDFALGVQDTMREAVFGALADSLRPQELVDERKRKRLAYPFEILSIGGDDLFLIVPAHKALQVACSIAKRVEGALSDHAVDQQRHHPLFKAKEIYVWQDAQRCSRASENLAGPQSRVSLSVGVVLADAHTPVFYLADLAEQLLMSAKRHAKHLKARAKYLGGTIDFLALKSVTMISGTVDQFRRATLTLRDRSLYARPYTIAEMEAMLKSIRLLKLSGFPLNQLYRLRESLRDGRARSMVDYLYFLSRKSEVRAARGAIEQLWNPTSHPLPHPWRERLSEHVSDKDHWETIWYDLAELNDFVCEEE